MHAGGGDADTTAAMAGALCGALHGCQWIPEQWYNATTDCLLCHSGPLATCLHVFGAAVRQDLTKYSTLCDLQV